MRREGGFTLVEVLVALVVMAIAVVAVLQLVAAGLRLVGAAGDHLGATLLAGAKLAELEPPPLEEGATEGSDGPYRWTRRVTLDRALLPLEPEWVESATLRAARVSVEVQWGRARRLELQTLRTWDTRP